jgi:hypothetical protein
MGIKLAWFKQFKQFKQFKLQFSMDCWSTSHSFLKITGIFAAGAHESGGKDQVGGSL